MNTLPIVLGVGIFSIILLIIASQLDDEHNIWKLFTYLFIIFTLGILVKASIDSYTTCEVVLTNSTVNGNLTTNQYDQICYDSNLGTGTMFLKAHSLLIRLLGLYILVYLIYLISDRFTSIGDYFKGSFNKRR